MAVTYEPRIRLNATRFEREGLGNSRTNHTSRAYQKRLSIAISVSWGVAIQARSAQNKGQAFKPRYFRRMAGLALLGVLHAIFVFSGDILLLYAGLGCLLWLIKDEPQPKLLRLAVWMLPVSLLCVSFSMDILIMS